MPLKIALYAVPFGFGPVSKAIAIKSALDKRLDVDWTLFGSGTSLEFMRKNAEGAKVFELESINVPDSIANYIAENFDCAVIIMHRAWADALASKLPVFVADSLGYMWPPDYFTSFPNIQNVEAYYVQDIFGSYDNLAKTQLDKIIPVSPIIDITKSAQKQYTSPTVVHLGGLLNPFSQESTENYVEGIEQIITEIAPPRSIILMSETARKLYRGKFPGFNVTQLEKAQSIAVMSDAEITYTSPGLTTLLELSSMEAVAAPLLPQNYSQALNIVNMVLSYGAQLSEVWHYLASYYDELKPGLPEGEAIERVKSINQALFSTYSFREEYIQMLKNAREEKVRLPALFPENESGADVIANDIHNYFQSKRHHVLEKSYDLQK